MSASSVVALWIGGHGVLLTALLLRRVFSRLVGV